MGKVTLTDGVYDIPAEDYHADPCPAPSLSSSIAKIILTRTPRHAWQAHPRLNPAFEPDTDDKFDLGSAAHALMLGDPRKFAVIDAADWRTKEAKSARDAARADGKIPLLAEQWTRVQSMVAAGLEHLSQHADAASAFTNGKPEQTLIWREGDIWCRARLDWLPDTGPIFDDYKSTEQSADPDAWSRILFNLGFDIQAAFYRRGIRALKLHDNPIFRFIVQETGDPFALSAISLTPSATDLADRKAAEAITRWQICLQHDRWPAWPPHTCYIDAPAWQESAFMERAIRDGDAARAAGVRHVFELSGIDKHGSIVI